MPVSVVRAEYEQLGRMAASFAQQAEQNRHLLQKLCSQVNTLQAGDWLGKGAQAFYAEMNSQVVPTLNRLVRALEAANSTTLQIRQIMQAAEDEAARCLRANGTGVAAPNGQPAGNPSAPRGGANGSANGGGGKAAIAGQQVKGIGLPGNGLTRGLQPLSPMDMLKALDKLRSLEAVDYADTVLDVLDGVNEYQKLAGTSGQLAKILKLPGVDKFGKVVGYYDISKNSAKLLKDLYNGELLQLDNLQVAGDLVADVAGQFGPLGKAYNAGYAIGKFIDGKLGLSSKLADFMVGDRRVYSTRTFVQEYVRTHGTPAEQAAYRQWRQEFNAQRAGQPAIPFRPPDLPVLKKIDPAILRMAETNKDIPAAFYDLSLKNAWIPPFFRDAVLK